MMKIKVASDEYLEKAKRLTQEESDRLQSRMSGKLPRRLEANKLDTVDALAIQLELENEQLNEWREKMRDVSDKEKIKKSDKK